jgi:arylsulfatase A-like enzyme
MIHLLLPHSPYVFQEDGQIHSFAHSSDWTDGREYALVLQNYERQVKFVDHLLGRFIEKLKKEGLYSDSVIIVTSDHGLKPFEEFGRGETPERMEMNSSRARVPLIIRAPHLKPGVSDIDYQHIDFKPTLLELMGIPADNSGTGRSVFSGGRPFRQKVFFSGERWYVRSALGGPWRPVVGRGDGELILSGESAR